MMFGGRITEADSFKIMDYAFNKGVNFIDTANVYNGGESERIVGKWLSGHRDEVILGTKVFGIMGGHLNTGGLSRRNILSSAEASLKRLGTDYIDIYYLHAPDYHTDLEETMGAVDSLVRAGKIRYAAVSNFAAWQIADILHVCDGILMSSAPIETGFIDLQKIVKRLEKISCDGYMTVEFFVDDDRDYLKSLIRSREYIEKIQRS